jgi:hypothetical protein
LIGCQKHEKTEKDEIEKHEKDKKDKKDEIEKHEKDKKAD